MKRLHSWRSSKIDTRPPRSVVRSATSDTSVKSNERSSSPCTSLPSVAAGVCTLPANTSDTVTEPATSSRTPATTVRDDDLDAQFRRDFHSQCAQHAEKFSALLQELERGHQQRDRQFREVYLATGQAFDTAQRGRRQQWLKLQEALERSALDMRDSLLARARDQREEHDRQASRGLQACEAFANRMLERNEKARHQVEALVRSLLVSFTAERNGRPSPKIDHRDLPSFLMQHPFRPQLWDITPAFPEPPPEPERVYRAELVSQVALPAPFYEDEPSLEVEEALIPVKLEQLGDSASSTHARVGDLEGKELMDGFDEHFSRSTDLRRQQWQRLQDFYDACFSQWQEGFQELQDSLTSNFILCTQDGTIGRILIAEEAVYISVRALFCEAEASRIDGLKLSWSRHRPSIASCHEDFIRAIKMIEDTHFNAFDIPSTIQKKRRPRPLSLTQARGVSPTDREVVLPFSLMLIFRRRRISQPLLTTSSRAQARNAFAESQRMRDRAFQASISILRADSRVPEAKRVDQFTAALFDWQSKAAAAERERTAEFERRMDATKTEWSAYHAQTSRSADDLIAELGKEFFKAQAVREEVYEDAVREAHALFMRTIGEFPAAYRALLSRICDEEERARPPPV